VMPGHVGTDIIANSRRAQGLPEPAEMSEAELDELLSPTARAGLTRVGWLPASPSVADLRQALMRIESEFREKGLSAADAAAVILDGVRSGAWRILVGPDAHRLDEAVRDRPEAAYDYQALFGPMVRQARAAAGEASPAE